MPIKRRPKPRTPPSVAALVGPHRTQHGDMLETEDTARAGKLRVRNRTQTMLDRYYGRRELDKDLQKNQRLYDTGCRLYALWYAAGGIQLRASGFERHIPTTGNTSDEQARKRRELNNAMRAVGLRLSPILVHVCICGEAARDWPPLREPKAGLDVLILALGALADHWRV